MCHRVRLGQAARAAGLESEPGWGQGREVEGNLRPAIAATVI